ncbi:tetratricopeptide repeat protein [Streptomyces kronopolitis]|uniref:tetratricopeptide repeat protein n=1 Tax=Streptomyces kronopolitis TaxID=1612435 RepID=UPI0036A4F69D
MIKRRRRSRFVGRSDEQATFQQALQQAPEEAEQFLFHIHGPGGVGKSTLARQLESAAREMGAISAFVDESVADPLEAMESIGAQLATQGVSSKDFDRALANYRQRRHEADSGLAEAEAAGSAASGEQPSPSPSSMVVSQLGLAGLGLIPGVGAFTGAVSASHVAAGADRIKARLSARLSNHEDVRLVLSPLQILTPVFLRGLAEAARSRPWVVLVFDTYERTGPLLDSWLRDVLVSDRYGELPGNVMVVLAGQSRLDAQCWGDNLDLVTDLALEVFTEDESRRLLAAKGVTDERVVELVLRLSEGLPVLVSMLAEARPTDPTEVGDPSGTAVERFLKWETDPARRAAALACALPLELDEDICRAAVDAGGEASEGLFDWLRSLPFVRNHAGRCLYHDVVRNAMLRLQRHQSPDRWREQHTRLVDAFRQQRREIEARTGSDEVNWDDERWRVARLNETYHRLCADPRAALPDALGELVCAYDHGLATLRRWVDAVARAGEDAEATAVAGTGQQLRSALDEADPAVAALTFVLSQEFLAPQSRALAHALRGRQHRKAERFEQAMVDYDRAIELGLDGDLAHYGRGLVHFYTGRYREALADFTSAFEANPANTTNLVMRAFAHKALGNDEGALADYDRALELDPDDTWILTQRGDAHHDLGHHEVALADYDRALAIDPNFAWAFLSRAQLHQAMERYDEALADFDRALTITPDHVFALTNRGILHFYMERHGEALVDFDRALTVNPDDAFALSLRGRTHQSTGRRDQALVDFNRALTITPDDAFALANRGDIYRDMERYDEALADLDRALTINPDDAFTLVSRGDTYRDTKRYDEALADFDRVLTIKPDHTYALITRSGIYRDMERYDEALADLDRMLTINPDHTYALVDRGGIYRDMERYDEALADFDRALTIDPNHTRALNKRGFSHYLMGRYDEALVDFDRALATDPNGTGCLGGRGMVCEARGDYAQARVAYDKVLDQDPDDIFGLESRAQISFLLGHFDAAITDFTHLLGINSSDAGALGQRANVHRLEKRYTEALSDLGRALEIDPGDAFTLVTRGLVYRLIGRYDAALADLTRAVELDPNDGWAHYERAVALHALGDPERDQDIARAVELLGAASTSTQDMTTIVPALGSLFLVHCLMPQWDRAGCYLTDFLAAQPPTGQLCELLAEMESLADVCPGAEERMGPFRRRLADALADTSDR